MSHSQGKLNYEDVLDEVKMHFGANCKENGESLKVTAVIFRVRDYVDMKSL